MEQKQNYFASNLKLLRQKYKMEQIDLANRLGRKSSSSVSEWEKGKYTPKAGVLNDIAKIFNISLSELMTKDLSKPSEDETETPQFRAIQRKAKSLSVEDQERLIQLMQLTFKDVLGGGDEDEHNF